MSHAGSRPLAALERLCKDAPSSDALLDVVGAWLADRVDADAHVFCRLDPLSGLWNGASDRGYPADSCTHFREHAFLRSEYADFGRAAQARARVRHLAQGVTPRDPYTEIYFDNFGFAAELHASFAAQGWAYGHLTVARRRGDFPAAAQRLLEGAVAPVTRRLRALLARETVEALPGEQVGLLAVDARGGLHGLNEVGRSLQQVLERRTAVGSATTLAAMAEMARRVLDGQDAAPLPRVLYVCPETRRRYRLLAERVSAPGFDAGMLIVAEPVRALDSVELLRVAGLTEREAEVALVTLRGFRSVEGADTLEMSEHTFLGHLKSVYRKLGVGSRGELASLLLGGL